MEAIEALKAIPSMETKYLIQLLLTLPLPPDLENIKDGGGVGGGGGEVNFSLEI